MRRLVIAALSALILLCVFISIPQGSPHMVVGYVQSAGPLSRSTCYWSGRLLLQGRSQGRACASAC